MNPTIKSQTADQTSKSLVATLITYLLIKYAKMETDLIFIIMPALTLLLAWISSKIGDPTIASFFGGSGETPASDESEVSPTA
jgi:hypothetical protein